MYIRRVPKCLPSRRVKNSALETSLLIMVHLDLPDCHLVETQVVYQENLRIVDET